MRFWFLPFLKRWMRNSQLRWLRRYKVIYLVGDGIWFIILWFTISNRKNIRKLFWYTTLVRCLHFTIPTKRITLSSEFNVAIKEATSISTGFVSVDGLCTTDFMGFTTCRGEVGFLDRGCKWWRLRDLTFLVEYRSRSRLGLVETFPVLRFSTDLDTIMHIVRDTWVCTM